MKVFVAGATGILGRRVVPQLVDRGCQVTAVARSGAKEAALRRHGATPVTVDLFDRDAVVEAAGDSDVVVNLATSIPPTGRMVLSSAWDMTNRLRSEGAGNLADAAISGAASRYVQESLAFVYPDRGAAWIDESTPLSVPRFSHGVVTAEEQVRRVAAAGGTGVTLRFGMFYAQDSAQTEDLLTIARRGWWAVPGRPEAYRSWVHVDDAARAVVAAVRAPGGTYNVVEDRPLTNAEHLALLGHLLGRRLRQPPEWLALGTLQVQTRSQRVSNRRLRTSTHWQPRYASRHDGLRQLLGT